MLRKKASLFILLGLFFGPGLLAQGVDPFEWDVDFRTKEAVTGEAIPVSISFRIPPKHFLYRDKISLSLPKEEGDFRLTPLVFSPSIHKEDPFFHKEVDIYEGGALIQTELEILPQARVGRHKLSMELTYQGCSESLCFRMMRKEVPVTITVEAAGASGGVGVRSAEARRWDKGLWLLLLLTFLGGLASDFTPCVLPIIPITLAFIGVRRGETSNLRRNFFSSLILVLSMSLSYALLGLSAALLGKSLGFLFQSVYFLVFAVLLYLVFGLSLLGIFDVQVPFKIRNAVAKMGGEGIWGTILAGFTIGFLAAPCVGPLIASLLLYVAQERDVLKGFLLLFSYGLGMGSLFLVIGTYYHRLASRFRAGPYTIWIRRVFAILLLIPAVYYGTIVYEHFRKPSAPSVEHQSFWVTDREEAFSLAVQKGKPLFVDFYASWCLPCVEMESKTFSDPELQTFLLEKFVPLKVDCTQETPQCQAMVERYSIVGWPTFLILSPEGKVLETISGRSLSAAEMEPLLSEILSRMAK